MQSKLWITTKNFDQQTKVPRGFCVLPVVRGVHLLNFLGSVLWGTTLVNLALSHFQAICLDIYLIPGFVKPATRLHGH